MGNNVGAESVGVLKFLGSGERRLDTIGGAASVLCAIHCAAMPFVITFLPLLGLSFLATPKAEYTLLGITAVVATCSLLLGYRRHRSWQAGAIFLGGIGMLAWGHAMAPEHCCAQHAEVPLLLVFGGLTVAASHAANQYLCHRCSKCLKGAEDSCSYQFERNGIAADRLGTDGA